MAAAVLAALQSGAWAQQNVQLQTVQVTAERRLENIRDVPSSVTALQGEMLEVINSGGQDIRMLAGRVPSLNIESSPSAAPSRAFTSAASATPTSTSTPASP
jgi:iron complex outermembrane receptor protein